LPVKASDFSFAAYSSEIYCSSLFIRYFYIFLVPSLFSSSSQQRNMLDFFRTAFYPHHDASRRLSSGLMYVYKNFSQNFANKLSSIPADGMDILVGQPPHTLKIHVSHAALRAIPALHKRVSEGATITNTDAIIFKIILQYIEQDSFFENMRPVAIDPFRKIVGGSDMILKLVKA
jgi:hypothetical protein